MLMKILEDYKIVNTVGEPVGKIKEAYLDLDKWEVVAFEVSPGALKKHVLVDLKEMQRLNIDDQTLIVKDDYAVREVPKTPMKELYPLKELMDLHVIDAEGEKVGKVYDLEIPYEKLHRFKIWKMLIKTGIKERRLRLSPSEVKEVMADIRLKKAEKEYVEHAE
ncbi:MAG: PRC-barrel domain-containing protein [Thermoplasmatota archaeon]